MSKRLFAIALAVSLLNVVCVAPIAAAQGESKEAKRARTMKSQIDRVGTGPKARIAIRLRDKTDLKGYVSEAADDHFVITDEKTSTTTTVTYVQVEKIKVMPFVKSAIQKDVSSGRIFKNAAIGLGLALTGVMVVCLISKRCVE
jgi:hypothetical protein